MLFLRVTAYLVGFMLVTAYALRRGGGAERWTAGIMIAGLALTLVDMAPNTHRFASPEYGVAIIDGLMLAGFAAIALTADRFWPLWFTATQAVMVLCHLARIFKPVPLPSYYSNSVQLWSYPQLVLLAAGTLRLRVRMGAATRLEQQAAAAGRWLHGRIARDGGRPSHGGAHP